MTNKRVGVEIGVGVTGAESLDKLALRVEDTSKLLEGDLQRDALAAAAALRKLGEQQAAIDDFGRLKREAADAGRALKAAETEASAYGKQIAAAGPPTATSAGHLAKLQGAAEEARQKLQGIQNALGGATSELSRHGIAAGSLAAAQQRLSSEVARVRGEVDRLVPAYVQADGAAGRAATGVAQFSAAAAKSDTQLRGLHTQLTQVAAAASALLGGQLLGGAVGDVSRTADAYTNLAARIRLVTGEGAAFDAAFKGVFEAATRTNSAVEATGQLFTKLAQAGKAMGVSQAEALALTETINQAIQISGASASSSEAAITQLVQGLQGGVLRGDEFNSVMEQAPRLAKALADGLGVTTGELRKMAEAGQLSADVVVQALRGQGNALQAEFSQLPKTVGSALQNLSTEWTRYVGEVDKANGISSTAAAAIGALAGNLDTLGALLATAGKAAAGYAALRLGEVFRDKAAAAVQAAAAVTSETAAVTTNTAALTTNTAAKAANAAASRTAAVATAGAAAGATAAGAAAAGAASQVGAAAAGAAAGGLAAMRLAGFRVLGLLGPIGAGIAAVSLGWDGIKAAGTWLGETAAKLMGARDRTAELEAASRASAKAAQEEATQRAALAQQTALAADKALGLTTAARTLVGDFDQLRAKGTSAGEALTKLAKDMALGSPQGIYDAVAALDALEKKGKVTGTEVREALRQALDGQDLGLFETKARLAFDGSAQGVARLGIALDAMRTESLARAGTSVEELQTGFSAAFNKAANDTDALADTLKGMGIEAKRAGPLLAKSIDKEIEAAKTGEALKRVEERLLAMGKSGQIGGEQAAAGLEKVRKKADEITPGINSVAEAATKLGVKTKTELERTANDFKASWDKVSQSAEVSLNEKIKAFARYRDAAIAANGGVESSEIALQRQTLQTQAAAAGLGDAFERAAGRGKKGVEDAINAVVRLGNALGAIDEGPLREKFFADARSNLDKARGWNYGADGYVQQNGSRFTASGQLQPPDDSGDWTFVGDVRATGGGSANKRVVQGQGYWVRDGGGSTIGSSGGDTGVGSLGAGSLRVDPTKDTDLAALVAAASAQARSTTREEAVQNQTAAANKAAGTTGLSTAAANQVAAANRAGAASSSTSHSITITLPSGQSRTFNAASAADARGMSDWLAQLATDAASASGG